MDALIQDLKEEIDEMKADVRKLEDRIFTYEANPNFNPDDVRYRRLLDEKQLLMGNLCELRTNVYSKALSAYTSSNPDEPANKKQKTWKRNALGEVKSSNGSNESQQVDYYIDSTASSTVELPPPVSQNRPAVTIDTNTSNPLTQSNSFPSTPAQNPIVVKNPSPAATPTAAHLSNPNTTNNNANGVVVPMNSNNSSSNNILSNVPGTAPVTISNNNSNNSQPIPNLQIEDYLSTKMRLAQIMRDFNEKKICFIGLDGSRIFVQQYQSISARVKAGEDIQNFLRGKLVMFVTAVDKKKRSITETKLFIPDFEIHNY